jgi:hypothetical protein
MYYNDFHYADKRLSGTFIQLVDKTPFYIDCLHKSEVKGIVVKGYRITEEDQKENSVLLEEVDLTPVVLGNFTHKNLCYHASRRPMRKDWKQGLSKNSLIVFPVGHKKNIDVSFSMLVNTVLNKYPTFQEALERKSSVAFSRDFSIFVEKTFTRLYYRNYLVGDILDKTPILHSTKTFLREHLEEVIAQ